MYFQFLIKYTLFKKIIIVRMSKISNLISTNEANNIYVFLFFFSFFFFSAIYCECCSAVMQGNLAMYFFTSM